MPNSLPDRPALRTPRRGTSTMTRLRTLPLCLALLLTCINAAQAASWTHYRDPGSRYTVDLPTESFSPKNSPAQPGHVTLSEQDGDAIIDVYSGGNAKDLSPDGFIRQLSQAPRIGDITYKAVGSTWFAISGHYTREGNDPGTLIYYAKFVFSPDLSRFAAFEISYSVAEKPRMDTVVTRLEKTLRLLR